ncbi:MAG: viperin family antiviral radical SAM protein [Bacteroidales bacterium]|jgi:nicotinamide mononucleotide adenylyltransferase/wyosine [tRNA(Phe)-imidazoG37] synthetase (radical SAM superfamily)|nr:viperin family antiviral radical SAM protein [Bacteroidales bacterium]
MKNAINFHLTDACNAHCIHCFVKKENKQLNIHQLKRIVDMLCYHNVISNFKIDKINLAGGEPMLHKDLLELIDYISLKNIQCSIITNGSLLNRKFIDSVVGKLYMIGISIDGTTEKTNDKLGRITIKNIINICEYIKEKGIILKINVCVSRQNVNENFYDFFLKINPDRIKLLQMIPYNIKSKADCITIDEFNLFCAKLLAFSPVCETNEFLASEYIIIDSKGTLSLNNYHNSINNVLRINSDVFSKMIDFYSKLSYQEIAELGQTKIDEIYYLSLTRGKPERFYPLGIIHGRFQCLHYGHIEYLLSGFARCKHLVIGITHCYPTMTAESDRADENRFKAESNPFSFYERMIMIRNSLLDENIDASQFDIVPFPIEKEEDIFYFAPKEAVCFITIYDKWGNRKKEKLNKLGLHIEIMWEKDISMKPACATIIRNMIVNQNDAWLKMVPAAVSKYILENSLIQKIKENMQK